MDFDYRSADQWDIAAWPTVTISIKNEGNKTAVVTRAECEVLQAWNLILQLPVAQAMPPSAKYDFLIHLDKTPPFTIQVVASHSIAPDAADRLQFTIATSPSKIFERIYHLVIRLYHDDDRSVGTTVVLVAPIKVKAPIYSMLDF